MGQEPGQNVHVFIGTLVHATKDEPLQILTDRAIGIHNRKVIIYMSVLWDNMQCQLMIDHMIGQCIANYCTFLRCIFLHKMIRPIFKSNYQ